MALVEASEVLEDLAVLPPVAAVVTGVGLPRVSPTAVSLVRTCPPCPQSSPVSAHLYVLSAHQPGLASDHQLNAAMTPDVPELRNAALTPVYSTTPVSCPPHTMDNLTHHLHHHACKQL